MPQLWVKEIKEEIKEELEKRKEYFSYKFGDRNKDQHDENYQKWEAKTPWAIVYSNVMELNKGAPKRYPNEVKVNGEVQYKRDDYSDYNDDLARNNVFKGIVSTIDGFPEKFEEIYHKNSDDDFPYRPLPTIESLNVENIDDYGAVRKGTIKFTCYTTHQLTTMQKLYMSPGASLVIQWGWSFIDSQIELLDFRNKSQLDDYKEIEKKMYASGGNYGAMIGKITKFNWDLNDDGSFNCSTEIVSRGYAELFENVKENTIITADGEELTIIDLLKNIKSKEYSSGWKAFHLLYGRSSRNSQMLGKTGISGHATQWNSHMYLSIGLIFNIVNKFYKKNSFSNVYNGEPVSIGSRFRDPALRSLDRNVFIIPTIEAIKKINLSLDNVSSQSFTKIRPWVNNLLIHVDVAIEAFSNSNTYKTGIENILSKLNTYSNGFWDLKLETSPEGEIRITDNNFSPMTNNEKKIIKNPYEIPSYGAYSMLQEMSFSSELPDVMKNAAAYGGVGSPTSRSKQAFSTLFGNLRDYLNDEWGGRTMFIKKENTKKNKNDITKKAEEFVSDKKDFIKEDEVPSEYWSYLKRKWGILTDQERMECPVLIPINLSFKLDGIEGFQFGNVISVDYLPDMYKNDCYFMITGISHDISRDGWTTHFDTQFRIIPKKIEEE
jgi:hypothetical protein